MDPNSRRVAWVPCPLQGTSGALTLHRQTPVSGRVSDLVFCGAAGQWRMPSRVRILEIPEADGGVRSYGGLDLVEGSDESVLTARHTNGNPRRGG